MCMRLLSYPLTSYNQGTLVLFMAKGPTLALAPWTVSYNFISLIPITSILWSKLLTIIFHLIFLSCIFLSQHFFSLYGQENCCTHGNRKFMFTLRLAPRNDNEVHLLRIPIINFLLVRILKKWSRSMTQNSPKCWILF